MRLLKRNHNGSFSLEWFSKDRITPSYAILSHTWGDGKSDEATYSDIMNGTGYDKPGFRKLEFCSKLAKTDGLHYFWVDTCCIDKTNEKELTTAINSMFKWYRNAARCYVYLSDVSVHTRDGGLKHIEWQSAFRNARWFTRGWTLQELLAPNIVIFYSQDHVRLGDKKSLERQIADITSIPLSALRGRSLSKFSIDERLRWVDHRQTTEEEDKAYCLLGILDISLSVIYGEGQFKAMRRLEREVKESAIKSQTSGKLTLIIIPILVLFIVLYYTNVEEPQSASGHESVPAAKTSLPETLDDHTGAINDAAFSPDSKLESVPTTKTSLPETLDDHTGAINDAAFSPDGKLESVPTAKTSLPETLDGHTGAVNDVAFSPDGKLLVSGSDDKTIRFWDASSGAELYTITGDSIGIYAVAFSPNGGILASGGFNDGTVTLWNASSGESLRLLEGHSGWPFSTVYDIVFSPDGKRLASASEDFTIRIWDVSSGDLLQILDHSDPVYGVAFSPSGALLASCSGFGVVSLWDFKSGVLLHNYTGHSGLSKVNSVNFSPDGKLLASASSDSTIRLWHVHAGGALRTQRRSSWLPYSVFDAVFSPDGKLMASASMDRTVSLWEVSSGRLLRKFVGHSGMVYKVAFSPDGRILASASSDKTIRLWGVSFEAVT